MKILAEFTLIPLGVGVSLSPYVAACEKALRDFPITVDLHANGTNLEGDWDTVMQAIRRCHDVVHEMGAPRISSIVRIASRTDKNQSLSDKTDAVARHRS